MKKHLSLKLINIYNCKSYCDFVFLDYKEGYYEWVDVPASEFLKFKNLIGRYLTVYAEIIQMGPSQIFTIEDAVIS